MDDDCFSQTAFGDEAAARMHRYEYICRELEKIYENLPEQEKDAFFQMILMKVQAAYFTNGMYYYADRSRLCIRQGKNSDAKRYTYKSHAFDLARRKLLYYYNHVMSNGKWNGILTPEDFPPPRTAMYPSCQVPLHAAEDQLIVTCWNNQSELTFTDSTHGNANGLNLQMQETVHCHIRLKSQSGLRLSVHFQQKEHLQKKLASFLAQYHRLNPQKHFALKMHLMMQSHHLFATVKS